MKHEFIVVETDINGPFYICKHCRTPACPIVEMVPSRPNNYVSGLAWVSNNTNTECPGAIPCADGC
jgi:hypothetical protein